MDPERFAERKERADMLTARWTELLMDQIAQGRIPRALREQARIDGPDELLEAMLEGSVRDYCEHVADGLAWTLVDACERMVANDEKEMEDYYIMKEE